MRVHQYNMHVRRKPRFKSTQKPGAYECQDTHKLQLKAFVMVELKVKQLETSSCICHVDKIADCHH